MKGIIRKAVNFLQGLVQDPEIVDDQHVDKDAEAEAKARAIANKINAIVRDHSQHARKMGRYTAFSLIGLAWTVSYQYSQFNPTGMVKLSFLFSIIYLLLDYFYHIFITLANKWVLRKWYVSVKGKGYQLRTDEEGNEFDPTKYSRKYSVVGTIQILVNAAFLVTSAVLLIRHILSVEI